MTSPPDPDLAVETETSPEDEAPEASAAANIAAERHSVPIAPGLYLVATPIGNLEDISLRALRILRSVDRIACEDTRQTAKLLSHFGIRRPTVSYHLHNERERAAEFLPALQAGERLALVSDAGMPGIADPGEHLVRLATEAGIPVTVIPGASAALTALTGSGLPAERFTFHGFLPAKEGQRRTFLEQLHGAVSSSAPEATATHLFYESPHRLLGTLADLIAIFGPDQPLVLARELTKLHEEYLRGAAGELLQTLEARPSLRGEFVLLLDGHAQPRTSSATTSSPAGNSLAAEVTAAIATGLSEKDALKQVAKARGLGKSEAYREWQRHKR